MEVLSSFAGTQVSPSREGSFGCGHGVVYVLLICFVNYDIDEFRSELPAWECIPSAADSLVNGLVNVNVFPLADGRNYSD